ncbi:MAG TPA: dihydropteroate synthase [Cyclobacteriaceae bacterium]|nr:dihydropteroate synthase [Cyclobacteriaceae bacterium]
MGVLNITPDSFYQGSRVADEQALLQKAGQIIKEGAAILDVGGYSSRPGADDIAEEEELSRVIPAINILLKTFPDLIVSVDTFRSKVAEEAISHGALIVNDISGGQLDKNMFSVVAKHKTPYILMHMRGTPQNMKDLTNYNNLVPDIALYFSEKITELKSLGLSDIIIDPGFGFAKTVEQNFCLLKQLDYFRSLGFPVLAGLSRKSLIWKTLNITAAEALNGTTALHMLALMKGANLLRVHDVKEAAETVKLYLQVLRV